MYAEQPLTAENIKRISGFSLAVMFPYWRTDEAGIASYHDEHERLVQELGWRNVIGSIFVHENELVLGVFIKHDRVIDGSIVVPELAAAQPALPASEINC